MSDGLDEADLRAAQPSVDEVARDRARDEIGRRLFGTTGEPHRLGRFVVLERLGRGGMGVVYSAYDPVLDRRVALKLLRPGPDGDVERMRARLHREAQALARLRGPVRGALCAASRRQGTSGRAHGRGARAPCHHAGRRPRDRLPRAPRATCAVVDPSGDLADLAPRTCRERRIASAEVELEALRAERDRLAAEEERVAQARAAAERAEKQASLDAARAAAAELAAKIAELEADLGPTPARR